MEAEPLMAPDAPSNAAPRPKDYAEAAALFEERYVFVTPSDDESLAALADALRTTVDLMKPQHSCVLCIKHHAVITRNRHGRVALDVLKSQVQQIGSHRQKMPQSTNKDVNSGCVVRPEDVAAAAEEWGAMESVDDLAVMLYVARVATRSDAAPFPMPAQVAGNRQLDVPIATALHFSGQACLRDSALFDLWIAGGASVDEIVRWYRGALRIPLGNFVNKVQPLKADFVLELLREFREGCVATAFNAIEGLPTLEEKGLLLRNIIAIANDDGDAAFIEVVADEFRAWRQQLGDACAAEIIEHCGAEIREITWVRDMLAVSGLPPTAALADDATDIQTTGEGVDVQSPKAVKMDPTRFAGRDAVRVVSYGKGLSHHDAYRMMLKGAHRRGKMDPTYWEDDGRYSDARSYRMRGPMMPGYGYGYGDEDDDDRGSISDDLLQPFDRSSASMNLSAAARLCADFVNKLPPHELRRLARGVSRRNHKERGGGIEARDMVGGGRLPSGANGSDADDFMAHLDRHSFTDSEVLYIAEVWGVFLANSTKIESVTGSFAKRALRLSRNSPSRVFADAMLNRSSDFQETLRKTNIDKVFELDRGHEEYDYGTRPLVEHWEAQLNAREDYFKKLKWFLPLLKSDPDAADVQDLTSKARPATIADLDAEVRVLADYYGKWVTAQQFTARILDVCMTVDSDAGMITLLNQQNCATHRKDGLVGWAAVNAALSATYNALMKFKDEIRFADYKLLFEQQVKFEAELKALRRVFPEFRDADNTTQKRVDLVILALYVPQLVKMFNDWKVLRNEDMEQLNALAAHVSEPNASTTTFEQMLNPSTPQGHAVMELCKHGNLLNALYECRRFRSLLLEKWLDPDAFTAALDTALATGSMTTTTAIGNAKRAAPFVRLSAVPNQSVVDFYTVMKAEIERQGTASEVLERIVEAVIGVERNLAVLEDALDPNDLATKIAEMIDKGRSFMSLRQVPGTADLISRQIVDDEKVLDETMTDKLMDIHLRLSCSGNEKYAVFEEAWAESQKVIDALQLMDAVRFPLRASKLLKAAEELRWHLAHTAVKPLRREESPQFFIANCKVIRERWIAAVNAMSRSLRVIPLHHLRLCIEEMALGKFDRLLHVVGALTRRGALKASPFRKASDVTADPALIALPETKTVTVDDAPHEYLKALCKAVEKQLEGSLHQVGSLAAYGVAKNREHPIQATTFKNTDMGVADFMACVAYWCHMLIPQYTPVVLPENATEDQKKDAEKVDDAARDKMKAARAALLSRLEFFVVTDIATAFDVESLLDRMDLGRPLCVIVTRNAMLTNPGVVTRLVNCAVERSKHLEGAAVLFAFSDDEANAAKKWLEVLHRFRDVVPREAKEYLTELSEKPLQVVAGPASSGKTTHIRHIASNMTTPGSADRLPLQSLFVTEECCHGAEGFVDPGSVIALHVSAGVLTTSPLNTRMRDSVTGALRLALMLHGLMVHRRLLTFDSSREEVIAIHPDSKIIVEEPAAPPGQTTHHVIGLFCTKEQRTELSAPDVVSRLEVTADARAVAALHEAYAKTNNASNSTPLLSAADSMGVNLSGPDVRTHVDRCLTHFGVPRSNWRDVMNFVKLLALLWRLHRACKSREHYEACAKQAKFVASPGAKFSIKSLKEAKVKIVVTVTPQSLMMWGGDMTLDSASAGTVNQADFKARFPDQRERQLAVILAGALGEGPTSTRRSGPEIALQHAIDERFWLSEHVVLRAIFCGLRALAGIHTIVAGPPAAGKTRVAEFVASLIAKFDEQERVTEYVKIFNDAIISIASKATRAQVETQIRSQELRTNLEGVLAKMKPYAYVAGGPQSIQDVLHSAYTQATDRCLMLKMGDQTSKLLKDLLIDCAPLDFEEVKVIRLVIDATHEDIAKGKKRDIVASRNYARVLAFPGLSAKRLRELLATGKQKKGDVDIFSTADRLDKLDPPGKGLLAIVVDECNTVNTGMIQIFFNDDLLDGKPVSSRIVRVGAINPYLYDSKKFMVNELPPALTVHLATIPEADTAEQKGFFAGILRAKLQSKHQQVAVDLMCRVVATAMDLLPPDNGHNNREVTRVDELFRAYLRLHDAVDTNDATLLIEAVVVATNATYIRRVIDHNCTAERLKTLKKKLRQTLSTLLTGQATQPAPTPTGPPATTPATSTDGFVPAIRQLVSTAHASEVDWFETAYQRAMDRTVSLNHFRIPVGIQFTATMREYLFLTLVCIIGKVPLTFVDVPGTGKTTALTIIESNMQGKHSQTDFFKKRPKLVLVQFQGRDSTTAEVVAHHFDRAVKIHSDATEHDRPIVCVLYDEAGMANESTANKALHEYLDRRDVMTVALSNSNFDAAVNSRFLVMSNLSRSTDTLTSITQAMFAAADMKDEQAKGLVTTYNSVCADEKEALGRGFHHHRDYLYMLRGLQASMKRDVQPRVTSKHLSDAVARNFAGLDRVRLEHTINRFLVAYDSTWDASTVPFVPHTPKELLEADRRISATEPRQASARFLLFITDSPDMVELEHWDFVFKNKVAETLWPSPLLGDITEAQEARYAAKLRHLAKVGGNLQLLSYLSPVVSPSHGVMNRQPGEMKNDEGPILYELLSIGTLQERIEIHPEFSVVAVLPRRLVATTPEATLSRFEKHALSLPPVNEELVARLQSFVDILEGCIVGLASKSAIRLALLVVSPVPQESFVKRCALQLLDQALPHGLVLGAPKLDNRHDFLKHYFEQQDRFDLGRFVERAKRDRPWVITTHDKDSIAKIRLRGYTQDAVGHLTARAKFQFCIIDSVAHCTEASLRDAIVAEVNNGSGPVLVLASSDDDVAFLQYVVCSCFKPANFLALVVLLPTHGNRLDAKVTLVSKRWHTLYMDTLESTNDTAMDLIRNAHKPEEHNRLHFSVIEYIAREIIAKDDRKNEGTYVEVETGKTADAYSFYVAKTQGPRRHEILSAALSRHALRTALQSWFAFPALETMMQTAAIEVQKVWGANGSQDVVPFANAFSKVFLESTFITENRRVIQMLIDSWGLVSILAADREKRLATVADLIHTCARLKGVTSVPKVPRAPPSCYFEPWFGIWCREIAAVYPERTPAQLVEHLPESVAAAWSEGWPSICLVDDVRAGLIGVHSSLEEIKTDPRDGLPRQLLFDLFELIVGAEGLAQQGSAEYAVALMVALQSGTHVLGRRFQFFANLVHLKYYLVGRVKPDGNEDELKTLWLATDSTKVNALRAFIVDLSASLEDDKAPYDLYVALTTYLAIDDPVVDLRLAVYRHRLHKVQLWHPQLALDADQVSRRRDWRDLFHKGFPVGTLVRGISIALTTAEASVRSEVAQLLPQDKCPQSPWLVTSVKDKPTFETVVLLAVVEWAVEQCVGSSWKPELVKGFDANVAKVIERHVEIRLKCTELENATTDPSAWLQGPLAFVATDADWRAAFFATLKISSHFGVAVRRLYVIPSWSPFAQPYVPATLPLLIDHIADPRAKASQLAAAFYASPSSPDVIDRCADKELFLSALAIVASAHHRPGDEMLTAAERAAKRLFPSATDFTKRCLKVLLRPDAAMAELIVQSRAADWGPTEAFLLPIFSSCASTDTRPAHHSVVARSLVCCLIAHCMKEEKLSTFGVFVKSPHLLSVMRDAEHSFTFADFYTADGVMEHGLDCGALTILGGPHTNRTNSKLTNDGARVCLSLAYAGLMAHLLLFPEYINPTYFNPRGLDLNSAAFAAMETTPAIHRILETSVTVIAACAYQADCKRGDELARGVVVAVAERLQLCLQRFRQPVRVWSRMVSSFAACLDALPGAFQTVQQRNAAEVFIEERFNDTIKAEQAAAQVDAATQTDAAQAADANFPRLLRIEKADTVSGEELRVVDQQLLQVLQRTSCLGYIRTLERFITDGLEITAPFDRLSRHFKDLPVDEAKRKQLNEAADGYRRFRVICDGRLEIGCHNGDRAEMLPALTPETMIQDLNGYLERASQSTLQLLKDRRPKTLDAARIVKWPIHGLLKGAIDHHLGMFAPLRLTQRSDMESAVWVPGQGWRCSHPPVLDACLSHEAAVFDDRAFACINANEAPRRGVGAAVIEAHIAAIVTAAGSYDSNLEAISEAAQGAHGTFLQLDTAATSTVLEYVLWGSRCGLECPSTLPPAMFETATWRAAVFDTALHHMQMLSSGTVDFIEHAFGTFNAAQNEWWPSPRQIQDMDASVVEELAKWVEALIANPAAERSRIHDITTLLGGLFKSAYSGQAELPLADTVELLAPDVDTRHFPSDATSDYSTVLWILLAAARHTLVKRFGGETLWMS